MKIKGMGIAVGMLVMVLLGASIKSAQGQFEEPEFVLLYAENQAEDYPTTLGAYKFAELVEERSSGRIKILVQAEGALGYEKEVVSQLQFGGIDFARVSLSQLTEVAPAFNLLQMPYLYRDAEHMWQVLDGVLGNEFMQYLEGSDLMALSWYDAGTRNLYNSVRPIDSLEDLDGLRIRVQESELMIQVIEALGAEAVPLSYAEVYSGIQTGRIDGAENNWSSYESAGHHEVAKYYTVDEHTRIPELQIVSQVTWNQLSLDDQELIQLCARESAVYERELWIEREAYARGKVIQNGTEVVILQPEERKKFQEAVQGIYEKYSTTYGEMLLRIMETSK